LCSFPFDKIKIDRSFIRELGKDNDCMAIIRAVMRLGSSLGMITTAEGVETQEQLEILRAEGCVQVQGFSSARQCQPTKSRSCCGACNRGFGQRLSPRASPGAAQRSPPLRP
jgi:EAL domain-containing protein (putative c-di-GMP-specific phosphodiesterase class I)